MNGIILVCLIALAAAQVPCYVESTGYTDQCNPQETCTPVGCRCIQSPCDHKPDPLCHTRALCGQSCCRSGEICTADGCRCEREGCAGPACTGACLEYDSHSIMRRTMALKAQKNETCWNSGQCERLADVATQTGAIVHCHNGSAKEYPCMNVDMLSFVSLADMGCSKANGNDIWGWSNSGRDFAIFGCTTGTAFIEITDPVNPIVLGTLISEGGTTSTWRDIKVYKNYAFIVSEARGHGMQIFDLTRLLTAPPGKLTAWNWDAWYATNMGTATQRSTHNIAINEETGYAYLIGCRTCSGGLLVVDISNPLNPQYAGCFSADGYTHDTQCVIYRGPDRRFQGNEICFAYNEDTVTIVDVTDKNNMHMLSRVFYYGNSYCHQGWLNFAQTHIFVDDELDEIDATFDKSGKTVTYIWDVTNLGEPLNTGIFQSPVVSIDHNLYVRDGYIYQSNYASGLRILRGAEAVTLEPKPELHLEGYFDVHPDANIDDFYGTWSNYPYYESAANRHTIVTTSIEKGLFVLRHVRSE